MNDKNQAAAVRLAAFVCCVAYYAMATAAAPAAAPPAAAVDNLDLASRRSPNAQRAVLTAITRAGGRLVAVGERGIILVSADGARTWTQAAVPVSVTLTALAFVDDKAGWAVGHDGVVLHTADGGATWTRQFDGSKANALVRSAFEARVAEARAILAKASGPARVAAQAALEKAETVLADATAGEAFGPSRPLLGVWFRTEREGVVAGSFGQLFRTRDGGKTWTFLGARLDNPNGLHLNAVSGSASGVLLVAAETGKVFRSDDGGDTWRQFDTGYNGPLYGVLNLGSDKMDRILAYGFSGRLFRSSDGGRTWQQADTGIKASLVDALALGSGEAIVLAQDGTILRSADGASHFRPGKPGAEMRVSGLAELPGGKGIISVGLGGLHAPKSGASK
jgi:photosystem II stability/assembly factor-like uncharacterized protein